MAGADAYDKGDQQDIARFHGLFLKGKDIKMADMDQYPYG
jgi:hypothetical protein